LFDLLLCCLSGGDQANFAIINVLFIKSMVDDQDKIGLLFANGNSAILIQTVFFIKDGDSLRI